MRASTIPLAMSLLASSIATATVARAELTPGEIITAANYEKVAHLLTPSIEWIVKRGATIEIAPYRKIEWPRLFREATEKYASQVRLGADSLSLEGHVAGQPFPNIDPNDPHAAIKVMWNYEHRPFPGTDDFVEYDFHTTSASIRDNEPVKVDRVFEIGESRQLYYTGRVVVDPKPELPNPKGLRLQSTIGPLLGPFDLKGLGGLTFRYADANKQDDTFLYLPSLRRIRRLSTAQRSSALFGQDADVDSFFGYSGHIAWMDWKFLGEREMLGTMHGVEHPMKQCPPPADFMYCDTWEPRTVYAIEGTSKLAQYAYGKRVLFIDKEAWVVTYEDIYDKAGQLWKVWIDNFAFEKQIMAGPSYEEEQGYYMGFVMVDIQLHHATWSPHPGPNTASDGWHFNRGSEATTPHTPEGSVPDAFSVARLIARGQ